LTFQVGLAKDDALTHQLIDYLMGEVDGIPKVYYYTKQAVYILSLEVRYAAKIISSQTIK
jgi:WD repeat-containing protein 19